MTKIQPTSTLKSLIKIILVLLILQVIFGFVIPLILDFRSGVGGALYYWPVMTRKEFETRRLLFKYLTPSEGLSKVLRWFLPLFRCQKVGYQNTAFC